MFGIKSKIRKLNMEKREEFNNVPLREIKKREQEASQEFLNFLKEWSIKYPEVVRVNLMTNSGSLFSFRTDESDQITIKLKLGLGIESI